jgi:hypothetical protein
MFWLTALALNPGGRKLCENCFLMKGDRNPSQLNIYFFKVEGHPIHLGDNV